MKQVGFVSSAYCFSRARTTTPLFQLYHMLKILDPKQSCFNFLCMLPANTSINLMPDGSLRCKPIVTISMRKLYAFYTLALV